jgi:hypothetical protein
MFRLHFMKFMSNINNSSAQSTGLWLSSRVMGLPPLGRSNCPVFCRELSSLTSEVYLPLALPFFQSLGSTILFRLKDRWPVF